MTTHLQLAKEKATQRQLDKFRELLTSPLEMASWPGLLSTMHRNLHRLPNLPIKAQSNEKALVDSQSLRLNRAVQQRRRLANQPNRLSNASLTKF